MDNYPFDTCSFFLSIPSLNLRMLPIHSIQGTSGMIVTDYCFRIRLQDFSERSEQSLLLQPTTLHIYQQDKKTNILHKYSK